MECIIYNQPNGVPAVIVPSPEALASHGIMAIARKDVPAGRRFKVVNVSDLPSVPQEFWTVNDADLTDGIGGPSNEFD
jgi:hypothetical protein